ncbi:MAG: pentapeptide repeat-containing protein [Actinomycetota bacterium]
MLTDTASATQRLLRERAAEQTLVGVELPSANLSGLSFRGWKCSSVVLTNANLIRTDFRSADLEGANLCAADLTGADLSDAVLTNANLEGANMRMASLKATSLCGANLKWSQLAGADLTRADLTGAALQGAVADEATRWPEGFDYLGSGVWMAE